MSSSAWYLVLKAGHLVAVFGWVSGTLLTAWALRVSGQGLPPEPAARRFLGAVVHWDRRVTAPALGLAWVLGLALASWGGWLPAPWLLVKLALALTLAALHGYLAGRLRRVVAGAAPPHAAPLPIAVLLLAAGAIVLAIIKPGPPG